MESGGYFEESRSNARRINYTNSGNNPKDSRRGRGFDHSPRAWGESRRPWNNSKSPFHHDTLEVPGAHQPHAPPILPMPSLSTSPPAFTSITPVSSFSSYTSNNLTFRNRRINKESKVSELLDAFHLSIAELEDLINVQGSYAKINTKTSNAKITGRLLAVVKFQEPEGVIKFSIHASVSTVSFLSTQKTAKKRHNLFVGGKLLLEQDYNEKGVYESLFWLVVELIPNCNFEVSDSLATTLDTHIHEAIDTLRWTRFEWNDISLRFGCKESRNDDESKSAHQEKSDPPPVPCTDKHRQLANLIIEEPAFRDVKYYVNCHLQKNPASTLLNEDLVLEYGRKLQALKESQKDRVEFFENILQTPMPYSDFIKKIHGQYGPTMIRFDCFIN
eukprot:TRINITY_DN1723_c0_g1_i1.p1 TRINITY_DN1723_c0_g1~~TRINITY_DN1723_c0_g1_i1.p1  ORF type:complete len:388 (-),score=107.53 TRINITY_DN1723_c0_g1_i1:50-1213(-)